METDDGRTVKGPGCAGMKTALARPVVPDLA